MKQARLFSAFINQALKSSSKSKIYYSSKQMIQSSVGLIFRCKTPYQQLQSIDNLLKNWRQIQNVQLLMTQRAGYQKDVNAYNVVFPGGQAEIGESDLQACKRQLKQQINIETDLDCIYVGKIAQNFYYAKKKGKKVYISCHIWILKNPNFTPKLNQDQLIDYRWVPISELADPHNLTVYNAKQFGFFRRLAWQFLRDSVARNLQVVHLPGMNVGMKRDLWGLTLWVVSYILQMSSQNIKRHMQGQQDKTLVQQIKIITQRLKEMQVKFSKTYVIGFPMIWMVKIWHHHNRVKQFTYSIDNQSSRKLSAFIIIIISICLIAFILHLR